VHSYRLLELRLSLKVLQAVNTNQVRSLAAHPPQRACLCRPGRALAAGRASPSRTTPLSTTGTVGTVPEIAGRVLGLLLGGEEQTEMALPGNLVSSQVLRLSG
jgi:hypothetical protein